MQAFKCNMWLVSMLTISYIYGCVGEEEVLFTNKPPNIEQTDINKMAIFEVNTQIASDGEEDPSSLLDQTTYATEILPTDAIDRDNITETTTIAGSDNGSEITDDWDLLDEGYLDGDKFDLDELAMADYDSYANNDTEDVSIKEMLKMNLSDEKLKGIMIIQDWLNNEKGSNDDGEITTTEFSEDKYDEYLKTLNYDEVESDLLNEENFNTERIEPIPEIRIESTTEFATTSNAIPEDEDIIQSTTHNMEIEHTTLNDLDDVSEDEKSQHETTEEFTTLSAIDIQTENIKDDLDIISDNTLTTLSTTEELIIKTEVPETTTLTTPNKSEQVEEETLLALDDEDNGYETVPTSGKIQANQNADETEEINYFSTESTTNSVIEIDTNTATNDISSEVITEINHFEESLPSTTTTEALRAIINEEITESLHTTIDYSMITHEEDVLTTIAENEGVKIRDIDISESSSNTTTESNKIILETADVISTKSSIESQNKVSELSTELMESFEKAEEFTTLSAIDIQTESIEDDNKLTTPSAIEIQTESEADKVFYSDIQDELKDEISSSIDLTTQSISEFNTDESLIDTINTSKDKYAFEAFDHDNHFNATEFDDDLKDTSESNSTDEPSTNPISSLEDKVAFETENNNNFNTTESVFENNLEKLERNSTDSFSKLDKEDILEDIEATLITTQANLDETTAIIIDELTTKAVMDFSEEVVETVKNNTDTELKYEEQDSFVELEDEKTNKLLTTQSPIPVQTEITKESDIDSNEPEKINFDMVDLEEDLTTEFSLDIQTESIEINSLGESDSSSNSEDKLENQIDLEKADTQKDNETGIVNSTELFVEQNKEVALVENQAGAYSVNVETTTKHIDEFEKQNIDSTLDIQIHGESNSNEESGIVVEEINNGLLTTQSVVDVTESQEKQTISTNEKLETTTDLNDYNFDLTQEIIVKTEETVETSTYVDVHEISTESVIVKIEEVEKEFVESSKNDKVVNDTLYSNSANENENKETELKTEIEDSTENEYDYLENVKEIVDKYNSIETFDDKTESNLQIVNTQNNEKVDFENEEDFIDIMHSSEDKWNTNKDLFTTRSSTLVTENFNEDKMFTLSESASEEINPIVVENEMEIESDPISGTTERVEISTSESLYTEPTVETELNLNSKKQDDDLSTEETEIDKVILENDLVEDIAAENTIFEDMLTTEQALSGRIHQEVVTKTVPIEESTMSVVIDESDEADITTLNNVKSNEDETRSSTELETVIPIENNGRFIFDLLTSTVTPLSEETTDSPTEKLTKNRLSEEKINLNKMYISDKDIILSEVENTTDYTTTTKSIDVIKDDAVFYNINLKPNSNTERHNILLNLKEESSSSEEIMDYLETISEDGDYIKESGDDSEEISNDKLDEIFNYSEEFEETLNKIEEILEENAQDAPYVTSSISNYNKEECLSLNMSMSIKMNETNMIVPETAKISGNCSEYFLISWKSGFDPSENNSIYFNLIRKNDCVYLQSIGVHVMKADEELFIDEANDDLNLDVDDTNYIMLNNGLSVQLNMSLKRKNVALEKPTTLKSTNTLALQITSGIASILILLAVVGVFIYRRHRGQTRILKVTIDK